MRKIGVFVGANCGLRPQYIDSTIVLAKQIAKRKLELVYGGADVGLMGKLANTVLASGGKVTGVIPKSLMSQEIAHQGLSKLHIVNSMQERKAMICDLSDTFIALPGGLGTFEEIFEVWNAIKIGLYKKPLGLLNVNGFFDSLLHFLNHSSMEGFTKQEQLDLATVSESPTLLLNKIITAFDSSLSCRKEEARNSDAWQAGDAGMKFQV